MAVMSFLSSRPFRIAMLAGVGVTISGLLYKYFTRRKSVVEDIAASDDGSVNYRSSLKHKLKLLLRKENVFCADIDYVEEVIDQLIQGGPDQLQVIADFDATMTPMTHAGKPVPSCHGVLEQGPSLPEWYKEKTMKMKEYYMAIEFDPHLSREEKLPFMIEWWNKAQDLLVSCSLVKEDVEKSVREANIYLREGSSKFLGLLYEQDIPLLVFSAGIGDVIEQVFIQRYKLYDNVHIIANWMDFSHEAVENASYFDNLQHRHNIILMGDSLGDLDIVEGVSAQENLLKIGYLNHHIDANLPKYKAGYDIVLAEEDSIELVQLLLENISNTNGNP